MSADPYEIRSQRNRNRRPAAPDPANGPQRSEHGEVQIDGRNNLDYRSRSTLMLVKPRHYLGYFSTGALIFNEMVGTGIFVAPATVLAIAGSKGISLILWLIGGIITWAGLTVYLEYGIRFPLTGGELHYIDFVWLRPRFLMTYIYSIMYVLLSGRQASALIFGQSILQASTPQGTAIDHRLQKFFAILLVGIICQLQSVSRLNYIWFSNVFAVYKLALLSLMTVLGWCALGHQRLPAAQGHDDPYGVINLSHSFAGTTTQPYAIALALLDVMRVYTGYENANFVLEEVRRPPGDETRVFRQSAKFTIWLVAFFYLMVNVAIFAACSSEELLTSSDVLSLFFSKVFGHSPRIRVASGTLIAISSASNIMSTTFAAVRVKQEIARMGILPWSAFWAKTTRLNTPGPALLLHWISSTIVITATPLGSANGYLVSSTLFTYARTVVGVITGSALLFAWHLDSFAFDGKPWEPRGSRNGVGRFLVYPLTILYILSNLFVFVVSWFPAGLQNTLHTTARVVPSYVGPVVTICCFAAGAVYWLWDLHLAPALGYRREVRQELRDGLEIHMQFDRHISGFCRWCLEKLKPAISVFERLWKKRPFTEDQNGEVDDGHSLHEVARGREGSVRYDD